MPTWNAPARPHWHATRRVMAATNFHRPVPTGGTTARGRSRLGSSPPDQRAPNAIPVGARVFHQKFGYGTVTAAEDDRLDVAFDKAGDKRVLDRFVEKA